MMKQVRNGGIAKYTCALVLLQASLACSASGDSQPTSEPASPTTKSGALPPSDDPTNPQQHPENQQKPPGTPDTHDDTTDPPSGSPSTDPPTTDPPSTDPPSTDPPSTNPPTTNPPTTNPPTTNPPSDPGSPAEPVSGVMPFRGVNLAGAEFGDALPGTYGQDYTFPTKSEVDYYTGKGMNTFRVGFKWERMQLSANAELDATYFNRLDTIVTYATSKGATVILNPHNFARYYGETVGSAKVPNGVFADFWKRLSSKYKSNSKVMFNLVNEPHDINSEQWLGAANAAIAAIRDAGANNTIVIPGNGWTGAHAWTSNYYGTPNSVTMLKIQDPVNNHLFEVHQYLDSDSGGGGSTCVSKTIGSERMKEFVNWLRVNKKKGFLGEFAGPNNSTCSAAVKDILDYVYANSDVMSGWTWWAGGPWWGDYMLTIEPKNGQDDAKMGWLTPFIKM